MTETGAEAPVGQTSRTVLWTGTTAASSRNSSAASDITDTSFRNPRTGSAKLQSDDEVLETTETHDAQAEGSQREVAKNSPPAGPPTRARVDNNSKKCGLTRS